MSKQVNYSDYLQLEKILEAQDPESVKNGMPAHDEMLFIIIHQSYELWFKQILHEIDSVAEILYMPQVNDNSPQLQTVVHRLNRITVILRMLVNKVDVLETMTPMDFLDFRDMLRPASGFQSWQFKITEAKLGLKYEHRHGQAYYTSQLREEQIKMIKQVEQQLTLLELVDAWLKRTPFFNNQDFWKNYEKHTEGGILHHAFWDDYRNIYSQSLVEGEKQNLTEFDSLFLKGDSGSAFSAESNRAALFIMLYRGYPMLQLPYKLLELLLEIDNLLSAWRFRHVNMVHRMIGTRVGTGGSSGKDYLKGALDKHYIFKDIARLTTFLIERRKLPKLSPELEARLGFA